MAEFDRTAKYIKTVGKDGPKTTDEQKLAIYKYFKQATEGDCGDDEKAGMLELERKKKIAAWKECQGMSKEEAKEKYVKQMDEIYPAWRDKAAEMGI
eukprot:GHVN01003361.1.p2 GENE.GHVN01003361.1~~GHVN01003361.1.p2  ORF type:complete len:110 (+),score=29.05 GHVN01003361.1:41-331(+)